MLHRNTSFKAAALVAAFAILASTGAGAAVPMVRSATTAVTPSAPAPGAHRRAPAARSDTGSTHVQLVRRSGRSVGRFHGPSFRGPGVYTPRYRSYRSYRYRRAPSWVIPGIAALIIGGALAASRRDYSDRWEMCADRYRSFSWDDGTFQPYGGGPRELCPYLRH